jgi:hypothetical protein
MVEKSKFLMPVKKIFLGVMLYVIAGLIFSVVSPLHSLTVFGPVVWIFYHTCLATIMVGYIFTFIGLNGFKSAVAEADAKIVGIVCTSYILLVIAAGINCISGIEWVAGILALISAILLMVGYGKLKKSQTFNKEMKGGFSILFLAAILVFIAEILGLIFCWLSGVGIILWSIFNFPAMIITLIGWNKVKRGALKA